MKTLNQLVLGERATILSIETNEEMKRRLLDIGFTPDATVTYVLKSPLGSPKAYEIKGAMIAIRNEDAAKIYVRSR